ncbi:hypothetical protein LG047_15315 [Methylocystis sp. WRRC1]|uniref:hypothetical protein n=1 Tax=Methylocystis sp. WRRC1 TaxID=1732014 RepID=UPI001D15CDED|nr:hypothetical protein [Methylocystis sp. WRRC1]MCC3246669.1 hypothetical protein [Methylocystis sp. WRRC1]
MSLPVSIQAKLAAVQAAYAAASPIETAPPLVFADLDQKAVALIAAVDAQVLAVGAKIDAFAAAPPPVAMVAAIEALTQDAIDELDAFELRSYIGRFTAGIELIEGWGKYFAPAKPVTVTTL